ncbi:hypothetical protein [Altererythrobacter sp.]|uniref:hypothetical protein n=1 Tax=Altererythrobacter sp. TaxID=1872480 RepID=UPI003D019F9D
MRAAVSLAASLLLASCGSGNRDTITIDDGDGGTMTVKHDGASATTTFTGADGTATMRSGPDVAIDLPNGFTVFPGAKVVSNTTFSQGDSKGALVLFESSAKPEVLAEFYRKQAEAAGIDVSLEMTVNDGKMIGGESEGGHTFSFNAHPDDGKTTGQLMVGEKLEDN